MYYITYPSAEFSSAKRKRQTRNLLMRALGKQDELAEKGYATTMANIRGKATPSVPKTKSPLIRNSVSDPSFTDPLDISYLEGASRDVNEGMRNTGLEHGRALWRVSRPGVDEVVHQSNKRAKENWLNVPSVDNKELSASLPDGVQTGRNLSVRGLPARGFTIHTHPPNNTGIASGVDVINVGPRYGSTSYDPSNPAKTRTSMYVNYPSAPDAEVKTYTQMGMTPAMGRQPTMRLESRTLGGKLDSASKWFNTIEREANVANKGARNWKKTMKNDPGGDYGLEGYIPGTSQAQLRDAYIQNKTAEQVGRNRRTARNIDLTVSGVPSEG